MEQNRMENDTGRLRSAYVSPLTEVYAAGPCALLAGTTVYGDPGSASFGEFFHGGGNAGAALFSNPLSGGGSAGSGSFGSAFGGGGGGAGGANVITGAKGSDFGVTFSDPWD